MQNLTPEQMKEGAKPWMEWFAKVGDNMVDQGAQLGHAMSVSKDGTQPGNPDITGYTIITAENIEGAMEAAKMNPNMERPGATIEVYELMPM